MTGRSPSIVAALVLLGLTWAGEASACACCDGTVELEPLRWTPAGDEVLVRLTDRTACEMIDAIERYGVGQEKPTACHDLRAVDPARAAPCAGLTLGGEQAVRLGVDQPPAPASLTATGLLPVFRRRARPLSRARTRVRNRLLPTTVTCETDSGRCAAIVVSAKVRGRWRKVWEGTLPDTGYCPPDGSRCRRVRPSAKVWPAPGGRWALIVLSFYTGDAFMSRARWAALR